MRRAALLLPESLKNRRSTASVLKRANRARHLLKEIESFETDLRQRAGYFREPQLGNRLIADCLRELSEARNLSDAFDIRGRFRWQKAWLTPDFSLNPMKIVLTGEIFTLNEPYANWRIQDRLTELGVCLEKDINLTW